MTAICSLTRRPRVWKSSFSASYSTWSEPISVWGNTTPSFISSFSSSPKFLGPGRSTNDQTLRLGPRLDPARQRQLLDVDHGNVVRTAHRDERRPAVLAEPDVGAPLPD